MNGLAIEKCALVGRLTHLLGCKKSGAKNENNHNKIRR